MLYPPPCCVHTEIDMASFASRVLSYIVPAADQLYSQGKNSRLQNSSQTDERCTYHSSLERQSWFRGCQARPGPINLGTTPPRPVTLECLTHTPLWGTSCFPEGGLGLSSRSRRAAGQQPHTTPCPQRPGLALKKGPAWNLIRGGGFFLSVEEI